VARADTLNRSFNPEQKGHPMAQIGTFKRTKAGLSGRIRTLALDAELILVPVDKRDAENAPDYRIHLGDDDGAEVGPEVGAGLETHRGKGGRLYLPAA
jgi:uncharacterized protein (DUF736 family)